MRDTPFFIDSGRGLQETCAFRKANTSRLESAGTRRARIVFVGAVDRGRTNVRDSRVPIFIDVGTRVQQTCRVSQSLATTVTDRVTIV